MSTARGLIGSMIGGVIGAAIWTAVSYGLRVEVGWIAWGIGLFAGVGMAAAGGRGPGAGVLAALVALASITGGKFATVHLEVERMASEGPKDFGAEEAKEQMAAELTAEYVRQGRIEHYNEETDPYPDKVWTDVHTQWAAMSADEQARYIAQTREHLRLEFAEAAGALKVIGLIGSFSPFDILWAILSVSTAFRVGSTARKGPEEAEIDETAPAMGPLDRFAPPTERAAAASPAAAAAASAGNTPVRTPANTPAETPVEQFRIPGAPPLGQMHTAPGQTKPASPHGRESNAA